MKNFEMPKMNISIFSEENIVTESAATTKLNELLNNEGVSEGNVTTTSFEDWTNVAG